MFFIKFNIYFQRLKFIFIYFYIYLLEFIIFIIKFDNLSYLI